MVDNNNKLNRCNTLPRRTDRAQQGCLDILARNYDPLGELGRGEFGVTIKMRSKKTGHVMAMKMTVFTEDSAREIELHCKLNKLHKMTLFSA